MLSPKRLLILALLFSLSFSPTSGSYMVGVGRSDITGPAVEITFMGYARMAQKGIGIHLRQYARAFIIDDGYARVVFVSVDLGMIGHGLKDDVIKKLQSRFGTNLYTESNVILSATHTHSAPGGFLKDMLFDISTSGFVPESYNVYVVGIAKAVQKAHMTMTQGRIFQTSGELIGVSVNRSPAAYNNNPLEERLKYTYNTDKEMVLLKFENMNGKPLGAIAWYAVHPTSMNNTNQFISSDNMGYASIMLEKYMEPNSLVGRTAFVAAFSSSNLGDVSPNTKGPRCKLSGAECDILHSTCPGKSDVCIASGPGVDMADSTRIIGQRLANKAKALWQKKDATELDGPVLVAHKFVYMPNETVQLNGSSVKKGCLPAMGYSFAAGTTDGPGVFAFAQGTTTPSTIWNWVRDFISKPNEEMVQCHHPKPVLLPTGLMKFPYQWQPETVAVQLASLGDNFTIAAVPGEFTTMAGRRVRQAIAEELAFGRPNVPRVVIAGLSNVYADYITTFEEYQVQRYEGASNIYGPYSLDIYLKLYRQLARSIRQRSKLDPGSPPPGFKRLISLIVPVVADIAGYKREFGDVLLQPPKVVVTGEKIVAKFISGNPRNGRAKMLGKSYLYVEKHIGDDSWEVIATDADWETRFIWKRISTFMASSEATVEWTVRNGVEPGEYRIRHFGYYKTFLGPIHPYEGVTDSFLVM